MELSSKILVIFLLVISLDFRLISNQSTIVNTDCIIIQYKTTENNTHSVHHLLQPTLHLKASGNSVSLAGNCSLGGALKICYFSSSTLALIIFVDDEDELRNAIQNISKDVEQYVKTMKKSNCQIYLFGQTKSVSNTLNSIVNLPTQFPFDINSDFYIVLSENRTDISLGHKQFRIWEIYSVKDKLFLQPIENQPAPSVEINFIHTLLFQMTPTKALRRQNLQGVQLVAAAYLNKEDENDGMYEIRIGKDENGDDYYESGLSVSIFRDIRTAVNFTEKLLKVYIIGDNYFEASFTSKEVYFDINLYHLGITKNRTKVAKPLLPTFFDGVHAIFSQPTDRSSRNIYGQTFTFEMWLTLLSAWTLVFLCCKLFLYLHSRNIIQNKQSIQIKLQMDVESEMSIEPILHHQEITVHSYTPFETLLWCVGTICQQGWYEVPKPTPVRLILITGLFLSITCFAAFTGKLTSDLYDVSKPIKSLKGLLEFTETIYLIASSDTSYDVLEGLSSSKPKLLQKIRFTSSDTLHSKLVRRPGRACVITWTDVLDGIVRESFRKAKKDAKEDVVNSQADAYICAAYSSFTCQATSSMYVPKDSELEQLFNYRIMVGRERGFNRRYWKTYDSETKLSCLQSSPQLSHLGLEDVFFAFLIIFCGICVKRLLPVDPITKKVSLRFDDETQMDIDNLPTSSNFLRSIPAGNAYFDFDSSLTQPYEGDEIQVKENLIREMFTIAENDAIARSALSGMLIEDTYLPKSMEKLMNEWNQVWTLFQNQAVCNQRLLSECIDVNGGTQRCMCRRSSIGRHTLYGTEGDLNKDYTHRLYYINVTLVNDQELINHDPGHWYKYGLNCLVTVIKDAKGQPLPNSCDYFLPMIGECRAGCVENTSCISVGGIEKEATKQLATGISLKTRIKIDRKHDVYHNKCYCPPGKICEELTDVSKNFGCVSRKPLQMRVILILKLIESVITRMILGEILG